MREVGFGGYYGCPFDALRLLVFDCGGFGLVVGLVVWVGWYLVSYCWFDVLLRFVDKLLILFVVWCWLFVLSCVWI